MLVASPVWGGAAYCPESWDVNGVTPAPIKRTKRGKMSGLWRWLVSLNDSQLTADFQRLCGIKVLNSSDRSKSTSNGNTQTQQVLYDYEYDYESNGGHSLANGSANGVLKELSITQRGKALCSNGYALSKIANGNVPVSQNGCTERSLHQKENQGPHCDRYDTNNESTKKQHEIQNKAFFYLFAFGAALGNEIFYILFFSCGIWNFDSYVFRKVVLIWCLIMYLGQASKDMIRWPRPMCPPVVRLEERYELEYGMPSTHAMIGVAIPFGVLCFSYGRYEFDLTVGILVAVAWSLLVSFSRLYLGMHSILDVLVGVISAACLMLLCIPFVDAVDMWLVGNTWSIPVLNSLSLALCFLYPRLEQWSTARGDTSQVLAVFSGIYQGTWIAGRFCTPEAAAHAQMTAPTGWAAVWAGVGRQLLGTVVMVVVLDAVKKAALHTMARLCKLDPKDPKTKQHLAVEFPYRYLSCLVLAFLTSWGMPMCFQLLGWHRSNFLFEVMQ